jgi:hypothetical protein
MQDHPADDRADPGGPGRRDRHAADMSLTIAVYLALVLFGLAQGVLGTFFYGSGPAPLAALGFDAAIFATCLLGAWGLRRPAGGLAPAVGWIVAAFVLANGTSGGSVLIAAATAGEVFLFGGAASVAVGVVVAFTVWSRSARAGRGGRARHGRSSG